MAQFFGIAVFSHRPDLPCKRAILCALLASFGIGGTARAVTPGKMISQYSHTAWRLQDGELPAPAYPIAQTADGYLWIGTQAGPLRFDGVRFEPLETLIHERLANAFTLALLGATDGSLWIGTPSGLSRWKDGKLVTYRGANGGVFSLAEDLKSKIWLLTDGRDAKPLCEVAGDGLVCHGSADGLQTQGLCCDRMVTDRKGTFWITTDTSVVRWRPNAVSNSFPVEAKIKAGTPGYLILSPEPDGGLWVGLPMTGPGLGLQKLVGDRWQSFVTPELDGSSLAVQAIFRDRHGALWVGTIDRGIYRYANGRVDHFDRNDGLSGDSIYSFFEDREGNVWVATSAGIDRFRDFTVWSYTTREGMAVDEVDSVAAGRDGRIWIGTAASLDVLDHGRIHSLRAGKELPGTQVASLLEDDKGRIWAGIDKGLWVYAKGRFSPILDQGGKTLGGLVTGLAQVEDGSIWAAARTQPRKLFHIRGDKVVETFEAPEYPPVATIAADHLGGVWLGLVGGDLARPGAKAEKIATHLGESANALIVASNGMVLAGASSGLAVFKDGAFRRLSTRDGLPCDAVNGVIEGDGGTLWMYMSCGLSRVELSDLEEALHDPRHTITVPLLDMLDGVRPGRAPFNTSARGPDGALWFANGVALQTSYPRAILAKTGDLPVHIEQLIADRKSYSLTGNLTLPALTRSVQFDYTATALALPRRVRFRYRLDNHDQDWVDAGPRRQAFYTDLSPGVYTFNVNANAGGTRWHKAGATVTFTVLPTFYQTRWFRLVAVAVLIVVLCLLFAWRISRVKKQTRALVEERHAERERIARELHDTFLQGVQGLMLRLQAVVERIPTSQPARAMMESALDRADEVMAEGRDRVAQLRAQQRYEADFPIALELLCETLARDRHIAFRLTVEGVQRPLEPGVRDEVEQIVHQGVANAFRHSRGTHVDVILNYCRRGLTVSIVDDGRGFDVDKLPEHGPTGHWGLTGMRERAAKLRTELRLSSRADGGTRVELVVRAAVAFRSPATRWRQWVNLLGRVFVDRRPIARTAEKDD